MTIDVVDQAAFDLLQAKLVPLWKSIERFNKDEQTIVVVPNAEVDYPLTSSERQAYEERFLFLLLLLRQPRARMVYVTGQSIDPAIVDYYLALLPGVIPSHARKRLFFVSTPDNSPGPLTDKLLAHPDLIEEIRSLIIDPDRAHLIPFFTGWKDRELTMRLGIPMYGADPQHIPLGTKSSSRRLFAEAGVTLPIGREGIHGEEGLVEALVGMRRQHPALAEVVVKLDEGVAGGGNADLSLDGLPAPGSSDEESALRDRLRAMRFELESLTFDEYMGKMASIGAVVEERIQADEVRSPSVQLRVTPLGEVELLSTHDQVLGGPNGQTFMGSRFPADPGYVRLISRQAGSVGRLLADRGVLGRFAIDFVVARRTGGEWDSYAIEINLRKGGTTHPFLTLQFLTDGIYDPESGNFRAPGGLHKYYVASDHVVVAGHESLSLDDVFDFVVMNDLHFDQTLQTGVVLHMMSAVADSGRMGVTAVGDSPDQADELYRRVVDGLAAE